MLAWACRGMAEASRADTGAAVGVRPLKSWDASQRRRQATGSVARELKAKAVAWGGADRDPPGALTTSVDLFIDTSMRIPTM